MHILGSQKTSQHASTISIWVIPEVGDLIQRQVFVDRKDIQGMHFLLSQSIVKRGILD